MHDLGIASSILECMQKEAERHPGVHISKVGVKIGELAGVDVDALQFGFEMHRQRLKSSRYRASWVKVLTNG